MDRKEFLSQISLGAAGFALLGSVGSCSKKVPASASNVNMTLDLNSTTYKSLLTKGNSIVTDNGIIVAHSLNTNADIYLALSVYCTHEGVNVEYQPTPNQFYCPKHGSIFNSLGAVTQGPAGSALKQYTTTLSGNLLTIKG